MNCPNKTCGALGCGTCHPEKDWPRPVKTKPTKIHLTARHDQLKGDWYEWYCTADMPEGASVEGVVQADGRGNNVAKETFKAI